MQGINTCTTSDHCHTLFFAVLVCENTPIHSLMADVLQVRGLHFTDLLSPLLLCLSSGCPSGLSAMPRLEGIVLVVQPVAVRPGDHSGCDMCQLHLSTFKATSLLWSVGFRRLLSALVHIYEVKKDV
ncbi:TPA: hypothetical protein ACH3X1_003422 [Trebouxia sp. C0004]